MSLNKYKMLGWIACLRIDLEIYRPNTNIYNRPIVGAKKDFKETQRSALQSKFCKGRLLSVKTQQWQASTVVAVQTEANHLSTGQSPLTLTGNRYSVRESNWRNVSSKEKKIYRRIHLQAMWKLLVLIYHAVMSTWLIKLWGHRLLRKEKRWDYHCARPPCHRRF